MTNNDKILELLEGRDKYFLMVKEDFVPKMDDEQLKKYYNFIKNYNNLTQLEKDVWYLTTQIKKSEIAKLYEVSKSYITQFTQAIEKKL